MNNTTFKKFVNLYLNGDGFAINFTGEINEEFLEEHQDYLLDKRKLHSGSRFTTTTEWKLIFQRALDIDIIVVEYNTIDSSDLYFLFLSLEDKTQVMLKYG